MICKNVPKFHKLLDIRRERLSKRSLWISFHFAICTSDIMPLHFLSQWSSRDGSSPDMVLVRLWRQTDESLDRSLMFLQLMFLANLLFTGLSKDSIPQTQQFPSLKRRMELVDQWQDAALRILTLSDNPSPKQGISPSEFCQFKMTFLRQQFKGFFVRICAGFRKS